MRQITFRENYDRDIVLIWKHAASIAEVLSLL